MCRYSNAMECCRQRRLVAKATVRLRKVQLRFAFEGWHAIAVHCAHARTQAEKLCEQLLVQRLEKSFRAWRKHIQTMKVHSRLEHVKLAQTWHTWQVFAATRRSVQHTAEVFFKRAAKLHLYQVCHSVSACVDVHPFALSHWFPLKMNE
jgi:hypothetical protein